MNNITIVKIGGNLIDNELALNEFLDAFASIHGRKLLVHGGGKLATNMASKLGIETKMVNGRRITDAENLKLVTMVYAGFVNKNMVASLFSKGQQAIGICGSDLDILRSKKREHPTIDFGYVGDIVAVNTDALAGFIENNQVPVVAPITHDGKGQLLNTNADSIVTDIAIALATKYKVKLIYSFEKAGVLYSIEDEYNTIPELNEETIKLMQKSGSINTGMMPKTDNALKAAQNGVEEVVIGNLVSIQKRLSAGTRIVA